MKTNHLLLIFCFLLTGFQAWAQPHKGSILIGGNAGFTSTNFSGDFNVTVFSLSPLAGFFVSDRVAVGGSVGVSFFGGDAEGSSVRLSPLVRYYFNGSGSTRFFGQGNVNWQNTNPGGNLDSESAFGFGLGVGLDYFFNEHVALEAVLGYDSLKGEDDEEATGTFGVTVGVSAFIGK